MERLVNGWRGGCNVGGRTGKDAVVEDEPAGVVAFGDVGVFVEVAFESGRFGDGCWCLDEGSVVVCDWVMVGLVVSDCL